MFSEENLLIKIFIRESDPSGQRGADPSAPSRYCMKQFIEKHLLRKTHLSPWLWFAILWCAGIVVTGLLAYATKAVLYLAK